MPFIGQQPITGAYSKLDSITTSATATYNLQLNGGAYYPQSANHLLVSLNGVMQAPQDSFTVSGSQITFASALTSSDNIDFIMALGDVLDIGTPSDGSVNTSQLANDAVTTAKILDANITDAKLASTLDLSGKTLTIPTASVKPMYVQATVNGLFSVTNDTLTKVAYSVQSHANGMTWDTTNYRYTFTSDTAGTYRISYSIAAFSDGNTLSEVNTQLQKNGAAIHNALHLQSGTGGGTVPGALRHFLGSDELIATFASGDYIELFAQIQVSSGTAYIHERQYGSQFILHRIDD